MKILFWFKKFVQFAQVYFYVLGFMVFVTVIDSSIDLKKQVSSINLIYYLVPAAFIFLLRISNEGKEQNTIA